jgi:hypothetical protein
VVRLCQGAADKEAGSYASNIRPKNIEEAIDRMRWFQHNSQAIYGTTLGRNPRREVKQVSPGPRCEGEARVCAIGTDRVADKGLERKMGEVLSAQGKEMSKIKYNIAALSTQMAAIMEEVKTNQEVHPQERGTNRDASTVGSWDTSRGSASLPSPVLTVLPPFFPPNPYLQLDQSLLRTPWLLPRSEAPEILV